MIDILTAFLATATLVVFTVAGGYLMWWIGYVLYALFHLPLYYINPKYRKER